MPSLQPEEFEAGARAIPHIGGSSLAWLTADQMREIDRTMVEDLGVTLVQMMENAGRHLAELVITRWRPRSALVLVGSGGNGGGGIVAARHLAGRGVDATIVPAVDVARLGEVPTLQLGIAQRMGIPTRSEPTPADVVVDALLGYSLEGDPRGRAAELIASANEIGSPICALDLPSGLDATSGRAGDPCVRAAATLTLAMPKAGLRVAPEVVGELYLADISVPPSAYASIDLQVDTPFGMAPIVRIT